MPQANKDWPPKVTGIDALPSITLKVPDTGYPPDKPYEPYLSEPTNVGPVATRGKRTDGAADATATPEGDSTPIIRAEGFASHLQIPQDMGRNTQNEQLELYPIIWPPSPDGTEKETEEEEDPKKKRKNWLKKIAPWLGIVGSGLALEELLAQPKLEIQARYVYTGHESPEICDGFNGKVYNLLDRVNRPVPPSEGLGYTNTHPNCKCYWEVVTIPTKTDKSSRAEKKHIKSIHQKIGQKAKAGTLHTVNEDGTLSKRTRGTNPRNMAFTAMREALVGLRQEFSWLTENYEQAVRNLPVEGKWYIIRASSKTVTDHRAEGEPYRRLLSGDELHALTRTAIGKEMDVNHDVKFKTQAHIYDAEYDPVREESQMLVLESDPDIIKAIDNGIITAVSINGGSPRSEHVECGAEECFVVPTGVVLGELDNVALTWVVTHPQGFFYKGELLPPAQPGVKNTVIEEF